MEKQYLVVAEQVSFRNNKLTLINIWDHFTAVHLPAKFNFDMVFICGPEWQPGEYDLKFKVKSGNSEVFDLGEIKATIANDKGVFNAIASNINFVVTENSGNVTFMVDRNGEEIFSREYPVNHLYELRQEPPKVSDDHKEVAQV